MSCCTISPCLFEALSECTYEVFALRHLVDLAPASKNVLVVVGDEGDLVDTLGLEFLELLDVGRKVVGGAARSEGTLRGMLVYCIQFYDDSIDVPGTLTMTTFLPAHSLLASYI